MPSVRQVKRVGDVAGGAQRRRRLQQQDPVEFRNFLFLDKPCGVLHDGQGRGVVAPERGGAHERHIRTGRPTDRRDLLVVGAHDHAMESVAERERGIDGVNDERFAAQVDDVLARDRLGPAAGRNDCENRHAVSANVRALEMRQAASGREIGWSPSRGLRPKNRATRVSLESITRGRVSTDVRVW